VQISSLSYAGPITSTPSTNSGSSSTPTDPLAGSGGASQDNSVVQQFLNYAKENPLQRMRDSIMQSMGITEQQFEAMPPAQQQAVEQKIEQLIKQKLQQSASTQPGQLINVSA
jgi:hypothetical protein